MSKISLCQIALVFLILSAPMLHAAGTVGNGTPASCTQGAFNTAAAQGGMVDFNCGPNPHSIVFTSNFDFEQRPGDDPFDPSGPWPTLVVDGGGLITLDGNNATGIMSVDRFFGIDNPNSIELRNLRLANASRADGGGGAVLFNSQNGGSLSIVNCEFDNNRSTRQFFGDGGAIEFTAGSSLNITNSNFTNNQTGPSSTGGAVLASLSDGNNLVIQSSSFSDNLAQSTAGALSISASGNVSMQIIDLDFVDNTAMGGFGGAVRISPGATPVVLSGLTFTGNEVLGGGAGGGLSVNPGNGEIMEIRNSVFTNNNAEDGGGLHGGGSTGGLLRVLDSQFDGNQAVRANDSSVGSGGGIYVLSIAAELTRVTASDNLAGRLGGGIYFGCASCSNASFLAQATIEANSTNGSTGGGGGVYVPGTSSAPEIRETTIRNNESGGSGGGLGGGDPMVLSSQVLNNSAAGDGGGIDTGSAVIRDSLIAFNTAWRAAGGIDGSDITVENSTISDNQALGTANSACANGNGGGIRAGTGTTISNSTISGNAANECGGGAYLTGSGDKNMHNVTLTRNWSAEGAAGLDLTGGGTLFIANTIVADNMGPDCELPTLGGTTLTANGNNLDSDGSCAMEAGANVTSGNAMLGPLTDNGGPAPTHLPVAGSDAIDTGDNALCAAMPVNNLDQRGMPRPVDFDSSGGAICDLGATELAMNETIDSDGDGIPDAYENDNGLNPNDPTDAQGPTNDPDSDGLDNLEEFQAGTGAQDPDSDGDKLRDGDDAQPTNISNACTGVDATLADELVRSGVILQCAADDSIQVASSLLIEAGGRVDLFSRNIRFGSGFAVPVGAELGAHAREPVAP